MPRSQFISPSDIRKKGSLTFGTIPVNHYSKRLAEESKNFTGDDLIRIYRDMVIIREFENMINDIKVKNEYNGIAYNHPGPAHLSMGQEASAVGMAYALTVEDMIFGSHRSHAEILAKGLSAIHQLADNDLMQLMKGYFNGKVLAVVEKDHKGPVKDLAVRFLLYGTLAE